MINEKRFFEAIDAIPLVSIDLILENQHGGILPGRRVNRPAQGYWFVPGGRIRKNEKIAEAIKRISSTEPGSTLSIGNVQLSGA
jgi:colanic acid biosynthesis protein WcaH